MTRAPNYGLAWQKRNGASFVRALRAERVYLIGGLQNDHALTAYWDDDKLILFEFGCFIASQSCRSCGTCLRQRFQITYDRVNDADQPTEKARA
jgi:hypothetical protein